MGDRDRVLKLSDEELAKECVLDFYKASGNGGQKRNKTSSAVRVRHIETGLVATDSSEREQSRNRHMALFKLRMLLALEYRVSPAVPPCRMVCAVEHADYPLWTAQVLDILSERCWELKEAAAFMGCSTSSLLKNIARDPVLWQFVNRERILINKPGLKK